jgi:hypothetical protein
MILQSFSKNFVLFQQGTHIRSSYECLENLLRHGVCQFPEPFLAGTQGFFGPFPIRDIGNHYQ